MLTHEFWLQLEYLSLAEWIGATWWFPLLNSLHVLSVTGMLGALLMLDLRISGLAARDYSLVSIRHDFVPWVWATFFVAVVTGTGMFITRASAHVLNVAFQWKMLLIVLAGANMWVLHRGLRRLDMTDVLPMRLRLTGLASLLLWAGVMLGGRWMGHIL